MDPKKQPPTSQILPEEHLLEYVERIGRFSHNRTAMHVHTSALMPNHRKDHNLRVAAHMFDTHLGHSEGELFQLTNGDIMFISRGVERNQLVRLVDRLRGLFSEDPLVSASEDGRSGFCTWYDVEVTYDELLNDVKLMTARARHYSSHTAKPKQSLDSGALVQLERILSTADITSYIRNQPVCLSRASHSMVPIFDELYVSIEDLRAKVCPDHTLTGNLWLFQYITQILDRRMLQHLVLNNHSLQERVISVNLNISTVLSTEFMNFDTNLTAKSRGGRLVIEIQKHDIFADMGAYAFAEQYLHERTHKLALDGITYQTLPFIDREKLKLDFIKLGWSPEILEKRDLVAGPLRDHIERIGPERFILMHCDSAQSIEIGRELGITMFQGRHISSLLQKPRAPQSGRL